MLGGWTSFPDMGRTVGVGEEVPKSPGPLPLGVPLPVVGEVVRALVVMSMFDVIGGVVVPSAAVRVVRTVVRSGRAGVSVAADGVGAGVVLVVRVKHLAVVIVFGPYVVRRRSGERSGGKGAGGREEGAEEMEQNPAETKYRNRGGSTEYKLSSSSKWPCSTSVSTASCKHNCYSI